MIQSNDRNMHLLDCLKLSTPMTSLVLLVSLATFSFHVLASNQGVHWSYSGDTGADHWGSLSPDFSTCGTGQVQSPIDISSSTSSDIEPIKFGYATEPLNIINNGHTVQVNIAAGNAIFNTKRLEN